MSCCTRPRSSPCFWCCGRWPAGFGRGAGGGAVCGPPLAGRVGGLGDREKGHAVRAVLCADAGGVPVLCTIYGGPEKGTVPICAKHPKGRSGKWGLSPFWASRGLAALRGRDGFPRPRPAFEGNFGHCSFSVALVGLLAAGPAYESRGERGRKKGERGAAPTLIRGLRLAAEKLPLLALVALVMGLTMWAQQSAIGAGAKYDLAWRLKSVPIAYVTYLGKFFWPVGLAGLYPRPTDIPLWQSIVALAILAAVTAAAAAGWRRFPYLPVGWLWFLGMSVPVIGFIQLGVVAVADRNTYLPQIGLAIAVAWGAADAIRSVAFRAAKGGFWPFVPQKQRDSRGAKGEMPSSSFLLPPWLGAACSPPRLAWRFSRPPPGGKRLSGGTAKRFGTAPWRARRATW